MRILFKRDLGNFLKKKKKLLSSIWQGKAKKPKRSKYQIRKIPPGYSKINYENIEIGRGLKKRV